MNQKQPWPIVMAALSLIIAMLACSSPPDNDQRVRTLVMPTVEGQTQGDKVVEPTLASATDTPAPTPTQEIEGLIKEGTHLVGIDIEPGIYTGLAGEGLTASCYWARLRNLSGSEDILANENAEGLYYVEVLSDDKALKTGCELLPIAQVPARDEFLTMVPPGTYLVGRDIEAGIYRGEAGDDIGHSCYWSRLSNVSGTENVIANDNATGKYFVEVLPNDFAVKFACKVEKME